MPGVNVPWSQVLYYLITLTVSGVFHEFGHAISAVRCVACCSLACKQAPVSAEAQVKKLAFENFYKRPLCSVARPCFPRLCPVYIVYCIIFNPLTPEI